MFSIASVVQELSDVFLGQFAFLRISEDFLLQKMTFEKKNRKPTKKRKTNGKMKRKEKTNTGFPLVRRRARMVHWPKSERGREREERVKGEREKGGERFCKGVCVSISLPPSLLLSLSLSLPPSLSFTLALTLFLSFCPSQTLSTPIPSWFLL
jgi:hypothetical protein